MKYKCDVCGDEFDDIDEAKAHESRHLMTAPNDVDSRVKLLEEHVKELRARVAFLERENRLLEIMISTVESAALYRPGQPPKCQEFWWKSGRRNDGSKCYAGDRTDESVNDFPGLDNSSTLKKWWEEGDDGK